MISKITLANPVQAINHGRFGKLDAKSERFIRPLVNENPAEPEPFEGVDSYVTDAIRIGKITDVKDIKPLEIPIIAAWMFKATALSAGKVKFLIEKLVEHPEEIHLGPINAIFLGGQLALKEKPE